MEVQADELSASGSTFFGADSEDELELRGKSSSSTRTSTPNEVAPMAKVVEAEAKDLSEAGSELSRALLEAQQALDAARHFVQSPSLARPALERPCGEVQAETPEPQVLDPIERIRRIREALDEVPPPEPEVHARHKPSRKEGPREGTGNGQAKVLASCPKGELPTRRASMEAVARQREAEALARAEAEADFARKAAARRAAASRRAMRWAQLQEEELEILAHLRREEHKPSNLRYAKSASRRVEGERARREEVARDVLATLHAEQAARREAALQKGQELQSRCQESNFSHCKAVVVSRRLRKRSEPQAPGQSGQSEERIHLPPLV